LKGEGEHEVRVSTLHKCRVRFARGLRVVVVEFSLINNYQLPLKLVSTSLIFVDSSSVGFVQKWGVENCFRVKQPT